MAWSLVSIDAELNKVAEGVWAGMHVGAMNYDCGTDGDYKYYMEDGPGPHSFYELNEFEFYHGKMDRYLA